MKYLKLQLHKYEYISNLYLSIIIVTTFFLGKYLLLTNPWVYLPILIIWLFVSVIFIDLMQKYDKKRLDYEKGIKGEEFIEGILKNLPTSYRYQRTIKLKDCDLDFIVIGENGIFGLEVKNMNGYISYDKNKKCLMRNGFTVSKYLKQIKNNCWQINKIIKDKLGIDPFVIPILVFSKKGTVIEQMPSNINILNSYQLMNFLTQYRGYKLNQQQQKDIWNLFI